MSNLKRYFDDYVATKRYINEKKKILAAVEADLKKKEELLLNAMVDEGMQQMKTADGALVYLSRSVDGRVKEGMMGAAVKYLEESGHSTLVSVNYQSMRTFIKNMLMESGSKPEELTVEEAIAALGPEVMAFTEISEHTRLGTRGL
jgi:hypothetical protein